MILVFANETNSGWKGRKWMDRFTVLLELEGRGSRMGPAICDKIGIVLECIRLDDRLHVVLSVAQLRSNTRSSNIVVPEKFNIYRLIKRVATVRAKGRV